MIEEARSDMLRTKGTRINVLRVFPPRLNRPRSSRAAGEAFQSTGQRSFWTWPRYSCNFVLGFAFPQLSSLCIFLEGALVTPCSRNLRADHMTRVYGASSVKLMLTFGNWELRLFIISVCRWSWNRPRSSFFFSIDNLLGSILRATVVVTPSFISLGFGRSGSFNNTGSVVKSGSMSCFTSPLWAL